MTRSATLRPTLLTLAWALAWAGAVLVPGGAAKAQHTDPPPPAGYALDSVTVVTTGGERIEGARLVVRGERIEALGTDASIPPGLRRLEGEDLHVYPGLVDAWASVSVDLPSPPDREEVLPWAPSRAVQGMTPGRRAVDHLDATGSSTAGARREGVVAAGLHLLDGVAPGRSATLLLRPGASAGRELVARPEVGLGMSFQRAGGTYPATLFAAIALIRQSFLDAERLQGLREAYERGGSAGSLPPWDPDLAVLSRTARGELPVFFRADGAGDIRRVLDLADELGFAPLVVGGGEAWKLADELAGRDVPVLVSVDFPDPQEWDPEAEEEGGAGPAELTPGAAREKERLEDLYANAGRLVEAGVRIALTSGGSGDLREGVRTAIEYGLSRDEALRALTVVPAQLLGIPGQVEIEEGAPANLVVTSGPIFEEGAPVRYTFVEGALEEGGAGGPSAGSEPPSVDVSGTWSVEMEGNAGAFEVEMTLEQEGASVTGSMTIPQMGEAPIRSGSVSGSDVALVMVFRVGGQSAESRLRGTVEGEEMEGTISGPMGSFGFTARRSGGPGDRSAGWAPTAPGGGRNR